MILRFYPFCFQKNANINYPFDSLRNDAAIILSTNLPICLDTFEALFYSKLVIPIYSIRFLNVLITVFYFVLKSSVITWNIIENKIDS